MIWFAKGKLGNSDKLDISMIKVWISIIFLVNLLNINVVMAGDILKGFEEYNKGNFSGALDEWIELAEENDAIAQSSLAIMYHLGQGVVQDDFKAFELLKLSAQQGYAPAQMSLGHMYEKGFGIELDQKRAFMWYAISSSADKSGKTMLELLKANMTEDQINLATSLVDRCLQSNFTNC